MRVWKYAIFLAIIVILILSIFSYKQYQDKIVYQDAISNRMNQDLHELISAWIENNRAYGEILSAHAATRDLIKTLMFNNQKIRDTVSAYRQWTVDTKMRKEGYTYDLSSFNADRLTRLYAGWYEVLIDHPDEGELNGDRQRQIVMSNELNASWLDAAQGMASVDFRLNRSEWLQLLDRMETRTSSFLTRNQLKSIEEIWRKRPES